MTVTVTPRINLHFTALCNLTEFKGKLRIFKEIQENTVIPTFMPKKKYTGSQPYLDAKSSNNKISPLCCFL